MSSGTVKVSAPTFENHHSGLGISTGTPRLSWRFHFEQVTTDLATPQNNWKQFAYEIQIRQVSAGTKGDSTHYVTGSDNVLVPWPGLPLLSKEQALVRIRAFGSSGSNLTLTPTQWSSWSAAECGIHEGYPGWVAKLITASCSNPKPQVAGQTLRPLLFKRTFRSAPPRGYRLRTARFYATALGVYEAYINGRRIGDEVLGPGWTSYKHRLNYRVFDVTDLMCLASADSSNGLQGQQDETSSTSRDIVLEIHAAEGWYAGRLAWGSPSTRQAYGTEIAVMSQLEIDYSQGFSDLDDDMAQSEWPRQIIATDDTWAWRPSHIISSGLYDGEVTDMRHHWLHSSSENVLNGEGSSDAWQSVKVLEFDKDIELVSPNAPPVRELERIRPISMIKSPSGKTIVDFGQNLVGKIEIRQLHSTHDGHRLRFAHAEVLENSEMCTRPLRTAKCTDELILSSEEALNGWSPKFTFHGFRYVEISGWEEDSGLSPMLSADTLDNLSAVVIHTDLERTGHFSCSNALINKLHDNTIWSMRGNFVSIPTDCPQRDERLGWTGDIAVFTPSANFLYNTASMLSGWMIDVLAEQAEPGQKGVPPLVVPNVIGHLMPSDEPQGIWGDVMTLTPWSLYQSFGDKDQLRRQYPGMIAWIDQGIIRGDDGLWSEELWQLGDWLDPKAPPSEPGDARTSGTLVSDAYLIHSTRILAQVSRILGHQDDAQRYIEQADSLKRAFQHKYLAPSGLVVGDTQTAIALVIIFELYQTRAQLQKLGARLEYLLRLAKFRIATGFAGTPLITHALTAAGNLPLAYRLLEETDCPSWLYPVTMGATTIWERWDSVLPNGSVNPGEMTSLNHYALGSIVEWLHNTVGGLSPREPGWKTFFVQPRPGGSLRNAEVSFESPYGRIECRWEVSDGEKSTGSDKKPEIFHLMLSVPPNTVAYVILPDYDASIAEARQTAEPRIGMSRVRQAGAGEHAFTCAYDVPSSREFVPVMPMIYGQQ